MAESDIQRTICDYLDLRGYVFWRNNNTPIYDPTRKTFRAMPKYTMKGLPDIIIIKEGKFIGMEVKQPGKYLSPEQKVFKERVEAVKGEYYLVRSLEDVIAYGF